VGAPPSTAQFYWNGRVDARDLAIVRANLGRALGALTQVPAAAAPASSILSGDRAASARRRAYVFA
jgi:hypothetical protein